MGLEVPQQLYTPALHCLEYAQCKFPSQPLLPSKPWILCLSCLRTLTRAILHLIPLSLGWLGRLSLRLTPWKIVILLSLLRLNRHLQSLSLGFSALGLTWLGWFRDLKACHPIFCWEPDFFVLSLLVWFASCPPPQMCYVPCDVRLRNRDCWFTCKIVFLNYSTEHRPPSLLSWHSPLLAKKVEDFRDCEGLQYIWVSSYQLCLPVSSPKDVKAYNPWSRLERACVLYCTPWKAFYRQFIHLYFLNSQINLFRYQMYHQQLYAVLYQALPVPDSLCQNQMFW